MLNGVSSDSGVTDYANYLIAPTSLYGQYVMRFNAGDLPAAAVLSQVVPTAANASYSLGFAFGAWGSGSNPNMTLRVQAVDVATGALLLNTTVTDTTSVSSLSGLYTQYSFGFTPTGSSTRILFRDESPMTRAVDGLLDNVTVVPEPGTLLGLGLGFAAFLRKRRSSKPA